VYQQERMDKIMTILKENEYVTVDYLVNEIRYSPASIRRDLTMLEKQGLVTRSYGGVTLKNANVSPFRFRQHSMKLVKNAISRKAADLVKDGDVVFIDGSSTTQYIGHFLTNKKDITVVTSNMLLADFLSEHGITTYSTGGKVIEHPGILGGETMLYGVKNFSIDIAFCSSNGFDVEGKILSVEEIGKQYIATYRNHSKKLAYLCGSDKFGCGGSFVCATLDDIDYFISDKTVSDSLKKKYKNTVFIDVE